MGPDSSAAAAVPTSEAVSFDGPMSSLVKLFFGAQKEDTRKTEGRTADNLPEVYHLIGQKVELLQTEIQHFSTGNRKLRTLLKEHDVHAARLKQDKAAWEQQKASDMEAFQKQMDKLQKERTKLEQQARSTISTLPRKEERRALDELKAMLAQKQEAHSKKEEQWRLTSNRLRKDNKELSEQTDELRKQIRRLEQHIFLQLDAQERPQKISAESFGNMARGRKERWITESRHTDGMTAAGSHLEVPTVRVNSSIIFEVNKPSKDAKCHIVNICDEATTMLAQRMKDLEQDVASWSQFHPKVYEGKSIPSVYSE